MPGTGKHGYTGGSLYGGNYNISNGIIQSGSGASSGSGSYGNSAYSAGYNVGSAIASAVNQKQRNMAASVAGIAGSSPSDYGDYIRELMDMSANNTAMSQSFAREQMEYQRQSDAAAMAWSANEAQKNRDWQERLSDSAHQREVKDLIAAGLNPILSANQGAYTGSGATGQGFSSSGAMGNVDMSATNAMGQLFSTAINTASQAAITKMYTDATKYQSDMQYAASKAATEASIFNNNNNINASRAITMLNNDAAIRQAQIHSSATLGAAGIASGATRYAADQAADASKYRSDIDYKIASEHNWKTDPVGYFMGIAESLFSNNPQGKPYNGWSNIFFPGQNGSTGDYYWSLNNGGS